MFMALKVLEKDLNFVLTNVYEPCQTFICSVGINHGNVYKWLNVATVSMVRVLPLYIQYLFVCTYSDLTDMGTLEFMFL